MRYNKYIAFLFFLLPLMLISQRYDNTWLWGIYPQQQGQLPYYGNGQGEFHTDTFISQDKPRETWFYYTNHSFSNEEGSLLFYTNGMRIKDSAALTITNGDSLNYGLLWEYCKPTELSGTPYNVWYSHFALPSPENDSLYYLFHIRGDTTPPTWKGSICYTIIKRESNGNLLVTQKNKLLSNLLPTYGGVNACRHANGRDWWIEFIQVGTNCLHKYLLTPDTIIYINSQCVGQINDWMTESRLTSVEMGLCL